MFFLRIKFEKKILKNFKVKILLTRLQHYSADLICYFKLKHKTMYVPKFAVLGLLGFLALAVMPFFLIRLVVFFLIIRLMAKIIFRHRYHRRFGYPHPHYLYEGPEPLEAGNYRFYARRFERGQEDLTPKYREKDLV